MAEFRKKPVVINAEQWLGDEESWSKILNMGPIKWSHRNMYSKTFTIETLEGNHQVSNGDWIIKGVKGEFYACKPDIFEKTYAPVTNDDESYFDVIISGNMLKEIDGEQFEEIKRVANELSESTKLKILVTRFFSRYTKNNEM